MGKKQEPAGWKNQCCLTCEQYYQTSIQGLRGEFCQECRQSFHIATESDAEELAAMIDVGILTKENAVIPGFFGQHQQHQQRQLEPVKPKLDPAAVAAGIRAQVDYRVAPLGTLDKAITYACFKNGLFEVRHSDLATIITKPKEVLGILEEAKEGMTLNVPKLPFLFLQQTISFFRGVEKQQKSSSEALVQIWWDRTDNRHVMHVPEQTVSGGGVRHTSNFDHENEGRYLHVADIHSHGTSMSAFWSGTDNNDEQRVTTERLFGVIGKVSKPIPEWRWRMRTRDGFIDLNVADIFEMPTEPLQFTVPPEDIFRSIGSPETYKDGRVSLWCPVDPFTDVEVPAEWYTQVKSYQWNNQHSHMGHNTGSRFGNSIKGFIYVSGEEWEVDGSKMTLTGNKLFRKTDNAGDQRK